ncbi:MAG: hypothetical protein R3297_10285, partial [Desulfobulbales bacterium]|nr:hypothetical protein [Desulfobulbales bacterium]
MKRFSVACAAWAAALMLLVLLPLKSFAVDEHGDDCAAAAAVLLNSTTPGSIDFGGDYDYFTVDVVEAGILTVWTLDSPSLNTYGYLYDANCTLIRENDKRVTNFAFWISHYATPGTYIIAVRHQFSNQTGDYMLQVEFTPGTVPDEPGYNCETAPPVALDSSTEGNIDYPGDYDFYRVELTGSGVLTAGTVDPSIDSNGYLYDANCVLLVEDENSGGGDNFEISTQLVQGNYFIAVRHYRYDLAGSTGSYTLEVSFNSGNITDDYGNDCATAGTLAPNSSLPGVINYIGD